METSFTKIIAELIRIKNLGNFRGRCIAAGVGAHRRYLLDRTTDPNAETVQALLLSDNKTASIILRQATSLTDATRAMPAMWFIHRAGGTVAVAATAGCATTIVHKLAHNQARWIKLSAAIGIAAALGMSVDDLLEIKNNPLPAPVTAEELKKIMEDRGWKPAELANKFGVTRSTAIRWLRGKRQLPALLRYDLEK